MILTAITIAILMTSTWVVSLLLRNVGIVDVAWGLGFSLISLVLAFGIDGDSSRQTLVAVLTCTWGLRLTAHLGVRNIGKPEDWRYAAMRKRKKNFATSSLWTVFLFQGVIMFVVSLPVQWANADASPAVGPVASMGVMLWIVGFVFESVGDRQLARFKADPANTGKVMDKGLWSLTRHPNYFGDSVVWWGLWLVAAETGSGLLSFIGPVVMTWFLMRVSGVPMLERSMMKRREGYADYVARTSAFFPRPPRRAAD